MAAGKTLPSSRVTGPGDVGWKNERLHSLFAEREQLASGVPKLLSAADRYSTALPYRRTAERVLATAAKTERPLRSCIGTITLNPTELDVEISAEYRKG
jgi:hypothetical protein